MIKRVGMFLVLVFMLISISCTKETNVEEIKGNFSCSKDSDCIPKKTGCNCCGYTYSCANAAAPDYQCDLNGFMCTCINEVPQECKCSEGTCQEK